MRGIAARAPLRGRTMTSTGQRQHQQSSKEKEADKEKEAERHLPAESTIPDKPPAAPAAVEPEKPPEETVLGKEDAMNLFRGGHKLKKKGDPLTKWFAATKAHGVLVICRPVDEDVEKELNGQDLVFIPD
jgi:hypothetical protein